MPGVIATIPKRKFTGPSGAPLAGGALTVYAAGTTTLESTWQDRALTIANTNPVTLDGDGACVVWLDSAKTYKLVLKDRDGATQWTQDNIVGGGVDDSVELAAPAIQAATTQAEGFAADAQAARDAIDNRIYPGTYASDPTTRPDGSAIQEGDEYFNSTLNLSKRYRGAAWLAIGIVPADRLSVSDYGASPSASGAVNAAAFAAAAAVGNPFVPVGTYAVAGAVFGTFYSIGTVLITGGSVSTITDLTSQIVRSSTDNRVIAHRGGALTAPEETLQAYKQAYAAGFNFIEQDCHLLSDGSLGVMHDATVDRTTTGTGNTASLTRAGFKALTIDAGSYFAPGWTNITPSTLDEVLAEMGDTSITFVIEGKNTGACDVIVATLKRFNIAPTRAIVCSFTRSELTLAVASGYRTMEVGDASTANFAAVAAAGVGYYAADKSTWNGTRAATCIASGIVPVVYTINRRTDLATHAGYGVQMFFSDDPVWIAGNIAPTTRDPFASQTWPNGFLASLVDDRGEFFSSGVWGYSHTTAAYRGALQGWACPIKGDANANTFSIEFDVQFDAVTAADRWVSAFICQTDDTAYTDGGNVAGYGCLIRQNGTLQIYKTVPGTGTTMLSQDVNAALSLSTYYRARVDVTPTAITLSIPALGTYSVTVSDSTYRGGFFHLGRNGASCKFKSIVIS